MVVYCSACPDAAGTSPGGQRRYAPRLCRVCRGDPRAPKTFDQTRATSTRLSEYVPAWPKLQCLSALVAFTDVPPRFRLGQYPTLASTNPGITSSLSSARASSDPRSLNTRT